MSDDRMKMPPERDFGFYQRRKHDKWRAVEAPVLAGAASATGACVRVADTHAHVHMLPDPVWELARCAANGVDFVCEICDPSEDMFEPGAAVVEWRKGAEVHLWKAGLAAEPPTMRFATGVHPHNARLYDAEIEKLLLARLDDPACAALGEIGLDFHYDLSPRDVQRRVFLRQLAIAKDLGLPVALHLRGGDDPEADNAHREAFHMLEKAGFPEAGTLLHCCALPPDELRPWIEAGCYVAYGGALTFKSSDAAREGALLVPLDRLLLETDAPYMTPEPMRGATCTPAHVVFTAARLAELRGDEVLACTHENALRFLAWNACL